MATQRQQARKEANTRRRNGEGNKRVRIATARPRTARTAMVQEVLLDYAELKMRRSDIPAHSYGGGELLGDSLVIAIVNAKKFPRACTKLAQKVLDQVKTLNGKRGGLEPSRPFNVGHC